MLKNRAEEPPRNKILLTAKYNLFTVVYKLKNYGITNWCNVYFTPNYSTVLYQITIHPEVFLCVTRTCKTNFHIITSFGTLQNLKSVSETIDYIYDFFKAQRENIIERWQNDLFNIYKKEQNKKCK